MRANPWEDVEIKILRERFADTRTADLALTLCRSYTSVLQKARGLGLSKSAAYLASPMAQRLDGVKGTISRFKLGSEPWNKGKKGVTGTHPNSRATQFKAGRSAKAAHNYVPIGSFRITKDGYLDCKLTDDQSIAPARRWVAVHRTVWEAVHGTIPKGYIVAFKQNRKTTALDKITIDALELASRAENMRRNSLHTIYPPEIAQVVQLRAAITRQINRKSKELNT